MPTVLVTFSFPDDIPRKPGLHPSRQQFTGARDLSAVVAPSVKLWMPRFPDRHPVRPRSSAYPFVAGGLVLPPQLPPEYQAWRVIAPALHLKKRVPTWTQIAPVHFPVVVPTFEWAPRYPAWIERLRYRTATQMPFAFGPQSASPVPALSWLARYPDKLYPKPGLIWHLASAMNIDPLPNPPAPTFSWQGISPAFIWPKVSLRAALQPTFTQDAFIKPPAPTFSWQWVGPDFARVYQRDPLRPQITTWRFPIFVPDILATSTFYPSFPTTLLRMPRVTVVEGRLSKFEAALAPLVWNPDLQEPARVFWRPWTRTTDPFGVFRVIPTQPIQIPGGMSYRPPQRWASPEGLSIVQTFPPHTIGFPTPPNAVICCDLELMADDLTFPQMLTTALTTPTMLTPTVTGPTMIAFACTC